MRKVPAKSGGSPITYKGSPAWRFFRKSWSVEFGNCWIMVGYSIYRQAWGIEVAWERVPDSAWFRHSAGCLLAIPMFRRYGGGYMMGAHGEFNEYDASTWTGWWWSYRWGGVMRWLR